VLPLTDLDSVLPGFARAFVFGFGLDLMTAGCTQY
jgi:hypothetical protein